MTLKKELRKERNKQAIKDAALEIAREEGWGGVTIRKIADRILYTPPVVYEHFKNKDDLYKQIVEDGFKELTEKTITAIEAETDPKTKIIRLAEVRYDFASKNPMLDHMMFDADNPEWQRFEVIKSMETIKTAVKNIYTQLTGDPTKSAEYALNMVCLIKGYTYFMNKLETHSKAKTHFFQHDVSMKELFINAIKRFLDSINTDQ